MTWLRPERDCSRARTMGGLSPVVLLLLVLHRASVSGLISSHKILRSNQRWIPLGRFGFDSGGSAEVNASDLVVYSPEKTGPPDTQSIGYLLASPADSAWIESQSEAAGEGVICPLMSPNVTKIFTVAEMGAPWSGGHHPPKTATATLEQGGIQTLYFINCAKSSIVSADVGVTMYNPGPGTSRHYLASGEIFLGVVEAVLAVLYSLLLAVWLFNVLKLWCQVISPPPFQVPLTLSLPLLASVSGALAAVTFIRDTNGSSSTADVMLDFLLAAACGSLLAAFFSGLERVDPYLTDVERAVLYISVPTFMICEAVLIMGNNSGILVWFVSPDSPAWIATMSSLKAGVLFSLGLLALLLSLELAACCCTYALSKRTAKDDREEGPLKKYYVQMAAAMLVCTGAVTLLRALVPYYLSWLPHAASQVAFFLFITYTFYRVRPRLERSVYQLFDENDDMEEELADL